MRFSVYPSLSESEKYRAEFPKRTSAQLLRIASSLEAYREIYRIFGDEEGAQSKMNERTCDAFRKVFPEFEEYKNDEFLSKFDELCDELEPDGAFDKAYVLHYFDLKRLAKSDDLLQQSENQSSVVSIIQSQAAQLGLDEKNAAWVIRILYPLQILNFLICIILGLLLFLTVTQFSNRFLETISNELVRSSMTFCSLMFFYYLIYRLFRIINQKLDVGALRTLIWIGRPNDMFR
jgi:hypothetical protein